MAHKKPELPEKICPICQRPFAWRKKWERNWDEIKYCSRRCANENKLRRHSKDDDTRR